MENEIKNILFEKVKDNFEVYEINKDDERYHKYFLRIKSAVFHNQNALMAITKEEFNKLNLYLERKKGLNNAK